MVWKRKMVDWILEHTSNVLSSLVSRCYFAVRCLSRKFHKCSARTKIFAPLGMASAQSTYSCSAEAVFYPLCMRNYSSTLSLKEAVSPFLLAEIHLYLPCLLLSSERSSCSHFPFSLPLVKEFEDKSVHAPLAPSTTWSPAGII